MISQRIENSGRTNQIRGFPVENESLLSRGLHDDNMMCYVEYFFFLRFTVTFKSKENLKTKGTKYERVIKTGIEQKWLLNKLGKNE